MLCNYCRFALTSSAQQVTVSGDQLQLQPGSEYQVVLHSDPILLAEGGVDATGAIATTVHIPIGTAPGFHILHVYGTNMAGQAIDVQKVLYVAASSTDYDGDGISNGANACLVVPPSGQDIDHDGIDDACDPVIAAALNVVPPTTETSNNTSAAETSASSASARTYSQTVAINAVPGRSVLGAAANTSSSATTSRAVVNQAAAARQQPLQLSWWAIVLGTAAAATCLSIVLLFGRLLRTKA